MPAQMRTSGPGCGCTDNCLILSETFAEMSADILNGVVDDNWYANLDLSSYGTGHHVWRVTFPGGSDVAGLHWLLANNEYAVADGVSGGPFRFFYRGDVPRHFTASVSMRPIWEQSIGSIVYANTYNNIGGPWYRLEVVASDATYGDADAETACGYLRIRRLLPNNYTVEIPIPGLCAFGVSDDTTMHFVKLCYNPDTHVMSGMVTTCFGKTFWIHTKQAVPVPDPHVSDLDVVAGTGVSNLWFEVTNWGDQPSADEGLYIFDSFRLYQSKNTSENYYLYGYGYGPTELAECACCSDGCGVQNIDLSTTDIDCRWVTVSGTKTQPGDGTLTVSGKFIWDASWAGVDDNCKPDYSTRITAQVSTSTPGATAILRITYPDSSLWYEGRLRFDLSSPGDGSISIYDSDGNSLGTATVSGAVADGATQVQITLCYDGKFVTFNALNEQLDVEVPDTGCEYAAIGSSGGDVVFSNISINHNIYGAGCGNCWDDGFGGDGSGPTSMTPQSVSCRECYDEVPSGLKIRFSGPICGVSVGGVVGEINGTYLMSGSPSCNEIVLDYGVCGMDYGSLYRYAYYNTLLPGWANDAGIDNDYNYGAYTRPDCANGFTIGLSRVYVDCWIGYDDNDECWVYVIVYTEPTSPGGFNQGAPTKAVYRASLGTCPVDLATILEYVPLNYVASCIPGCAGDSSDQFCQWSQFNVSVRR